MPKQRPNASQCLFETPNSETTTQDWEMILTLPLQTLKADTSPFVQRRKNVRSRNITQLHCKNIFKIHPNISQHEIVQAAKLLMLFLRGNVCGDSPSWSQLGRKQFLLAVPKSTQLNILNILNTVFSRSSVHVCACKSIVREFRPWKNTLITWANHPRKRHEKFEQQNRADAFYAFYAFYFHLGVLFRFCDCDRFAPKSSRDFSSVRERWSQQASMSMPVKHSSHRGSIPMYSGFLVDREPIWKDPLECRLSGHDLEQNWESQNLLQWLNHDRHIHAYPA
jgi:hypothetical protein